MVEASAVVAAEVRNLAQRSATAAKEIGIDQRVDPARQRRQRVGQPIRENAGRDRQLGQTRDRYHRIANHGGVSGTKPRASIRSIKPSCKWTKRPTERGLGGRNDIGQSVDEGSGQGIDEPDGRVRGQLVRRAYVHTQCRSGGQDCNQTWYHRREASPEKPTFSSKSADAKPVGVAAGNGHDRHKKDDDFEEFWHLGPRVGNNCPPSGLTFSLFSSIPALHVYHDPPQN